MDGKICSADLRFSTDVEITELFFARNEEAIVKTQQKYGRLFMSIASGILGNSEDAAECVNDAYLKMWNSIPPERPRSVKAYGGRIVRNLSINRAEYNSAAKRGGGAILEELDESVPDGSRFGEEDLSQLIDSFLRKLDKTSRVTFVLRYWYCMPIEKIAEKTGSGESAVKSRLFRTREKLKKYLEKEGVSL